MSDYTTKATVDLDVNGEKAKQAIAEQRVLVENLRKAYAKAKAEGEESAKPLEKEYKKARRELKSMEDATLNVASVLKRLDRATPKELKTALRQLNKELNTMQRGSKAWNEQVAKIQKVKKELDAVNASLATQRTRWQKLNDWVAKWQTMILGGVAFFTRLKSIGNDAVQAYADMDSAMANTQKFTGMTREEVEQLNDEFKKMDTRTSREQLNELAASAGRLGKSSVEDVMGFVRAGDIIGVAMDELGQDAPEIISKLAGIFNLESEMGTEKAMLSVGSAINSLSQTCAASAPNLVEFSSRMGAIANQTNMTMDEMLAFGALLDSNNVTMEKASTAMQGVITKMYANPAKFAKAAGLDIEQFTAALQRSSTEGIMMFVNALSRMNQMQMASVLSSLGTAGAGVVQTFQTLAGKIGNLKLLMEQSKNAFIEATSATEEFNVQNNTIQARLDKVKKKFTELAVTLGEKLLPFMGHVKSATSILMKVMLETLKFLVEHKNLIIAIALAYGSYKVVVGAASMAQKIHNAYMVISSGSTKVLTATTLLFKAAMFALTGQIGKAKIAMRAFAIATASTPWGAVITAVGALVGGYVLLNEVTEENIELDEEAIRKQNELAEATEKRNKAREDALSNIDKEKIRLYELDKIANNELLSKEARLNAIKELNAIIPGYNAYLDDECDAYVRNKQALDEYIKSMEKRMMATYFKDQYEEYLTELSTASRKFDKFLASNDSFYSDYMDEANDFLNSPNDYFYMNALGNDPILSMRYDASPQEAHSVLQAREAARLALVKESKEQDGDFNIPKEYFDVSQAYFNAVQNVVNLRKEMRNLGISFDDADNPSNLDISPINLHDNDNGNKNNRFSVEDEKRAEAESKAKIAYAQQELSHEQYVLAMRQIEIDYYDELLRRQDLSQTERLQYEAKYYEAKRELLDTSIEYEEARTISAQKEALITAQEDYRNLVAKIKERYLNGEIETADEYHKAIELAELNHYHALANNQNISQEERSKALGKYHQLITSQQEKAIQDMIRAETDFADKVKQVREEIFGLSTSERQSGYDADVNVLRSARNTAIELAGGENASSEDLAAIEKAYQSGLFALKEKWNPTELADDMDLGNALQQGFESFGDWLNSDGTQLVFSACEAIVGKMSGIFSGLSSIVDAELQIQTAKIENKYDKEIALAEGNSYQIQKLERKKEQELANAKNDAEKKKYNMKVIETIAQTAMNVNAAVGAGMQYGVAAPIMVPVLTGIAVATGAIQLAALKKQQQASAASGYASGGFTPKGGKYEPAGIVHKGEWVASQELLASPVARPMIEALDYAQRTNTIGSLSGEDVSHSITAPMILANNQSTPQVVVSQPAPTIVVNQNDEYVSTMKKLSERLAEPFVTINTVTGDTGMKKAQDDYEKFIKNKTPKSKRKSK